MRLTLCRLLTGWKFTTTLETKVLSPVFELLIFAHGLRGNLKVAFFARFEMYCAEHRESKAVSSMKTFPWKGTEVSKLKVTHFVEQVTTGVPKIHSRLF